MNKQLTIIVMLQSIKLFMMTMPVIVIYWEENGLTMQDIFMLQAVFSIALVVLEVPSGYFADTFGRKKSILYGCVFATIGYFMFWWWPGYTGFMLGELSLALGASLMSGAKEALVHESLEQNVRERDNLKWQSRLFIAGNLSEATAAVTTSFVVLFYNVETVFLLQWLLIALTVPLSLLLRETRHTSAIPTPALLQIVAGSWVHNKKLQALNIYVSGLAAATLTMVWFIQPHWQLMSVDITFFGYLWAGLNMLVAFGASLAPKLERRFAFRTLFVAATAIIITIYITMAVSVQTWVALLVAPLVWLLRGMYFPIIIDYVQRESKDEEKATVLSINKIGPRLVFAIFSPFLGWLTDVYTLSIAFAASALIFGIICSIGVLFLHFAYLTKKKVS